METKTNARRVSLPTLLRSAFLALGVAALSAGSAHAAGEVADFTYSYDYQGNMLSRVDANTAVTESFCYDSLNRLTEWDDDGTCGGGESAAYAANGNITSKTGVGTYTYPSSSSAQPHGVSQISGTAYGLTSPKFTYDGNGNLTCVYTDGSCTPGSEPREIAYTGFDMVSTMKENGTTKLAYTYDSGNDRIKSVDSSGSPTVTTYYLSDPISGARSEKIVVSGGTTTFKDQLFAGGKLVSQRSKVDSNTPSFNHFVTDVLGSVAVITDAAGSNICRLAYDPWGKRVGSSACAPTTRGYTDHEMIDDFGLINMNARIYDPVLARFMTPDPITVSFQQHGMNAFAYVINNPLKFTDPTGMLVCTNCPPGGPAEVVVIGRIPPPLSGVDVGRQDGSTVSMNALNEMDGWIKSIYAQIRLAMMQTFHGNRQLIANYTNYQWVNDGGAAIPPTSNGTTMPEVVITAQFIEDYADAIQRANDFLDRGPYMAGGNGPLLHQAGAGVLLQGGKVAGQCLVNPGCRAALMEALKAGSVTAAMAAISEYANSNSQAGTATIYQNGDHVSILVSTGSGSLHTEQVVDSARQRRLP